jgi:hypothetical protein
MRLERMAAFAIAVAVALWFTLYRDAPAYPPRMQASLAAAAVSFLVVLVLLYRIGRGRWRGIAVAGFAVSAAGLALWAAGGTLSTMSVRAGDQDSTWGRLALELLTRPQPGWGLFCIGLIPIGLGATTARLPLPLRLLLPLGGLFVAGEPLKYFLGETQGGMAVLIAFGLGWLAIGALLLSGARRA